MDAILEQKFRAVEVLIMQEGFSIVIQFMCDAPLIFIKCGRQTPLCDSDGNRKNDLERDLEMVIWRKTIIVQYIIRMAYSRKCSRLSYLSNNKKRQCLALASEIRLCL